MVCLGFEPGAAEWKVQTNPLCYAGTPTASMFLLLESNFMIIHVLKWWGFWQEFYVRGQSF